MKSSGNKNEISHNCTRHYTRRPAGKCLIFIIKVVPTSEFVCYSLDLLDLPESASGSGKNKEQLGKVVNQLGKMPF